MGKRKDAPGWCEFVDLCATIQSPEALKKVLDLFLTIEEKETLSKRLLIIRALRKKDLTQREIAQHFGVSIAQITRGSNALKIVDPSLITLLDKLL